MRATFAASCALSRRCGRIAAGAALAWALAACAPAGAPAGADADRGAPSHPAAPAAGAGSPDGASLAGPQSGDEAALSSPAGTYVRAGPGVARLTLTPDGEGWQVRLQVGGDPADGAGIAADCELHARGLLRGDRIDAAVVPFESETLSVSQADLQASPADVHVVLDGDTARVETDFRGCALHMDLGGRFVRQD